MFTLLYLSRLTAYLFAKFGNVKMGPNQNNSVGNPSKHGPPSVMVGD